MKKIDFLIFIDVKTIHRWHNKKKSKRKTLKKAKLKSNTVDDTQFSDISISDGSFSQTVSVRQHFRPIQFDSLIHPHGDNKEHDKDAEKQTNNDLSSNHCCIIC